MPATPSASVPRRRRRALRTLLILLVSLTALTALLPAMLSTAPARDFLLARISQRMGVGIEASSLRLTWTSGLELRGLVAVQPLVSTTRVEQVTVERGLWPILRDRNAGLVTLSPPGGPACRRGVHRHLRRAFRPGRPGPCLLPAPRGARRRARRHAATV
jgi:hypothetical protein